MKTAQVNKLYGKLTPQEQASIVLEAVSRLDESTVDAVLGQVERKTYLSVHADYIRQMNALQWLISVYGLEYWKNRALMLAACDMVEAGNKHAEERANQFFVKTVAIELALVAVCQQFKVDVSAIKTMVDCVPNEMEGYEMPEVDKELIKKYAELFSKVAN
jgi:hypothetical protein